MRLVAAGANRPDGTLLGPTLAGLAKLAPLPPGIAVHPGRGDDRAATRALLAEHGFGAAIAGAGAPARPRCRWVVERTHAWLNGHGTLRRGTEQRATVVTFHLFLAAACVVVRLPVATARVSSRWPRRPTTRRLK